MISNSNNYKSKLNTKKLLIIGNGFDLHQHLNSSFDDFFNSSFFNKKSNLNGDHSVLKKDGDRDFFFQQIVLLNNQEHRIFKTPNDFIAYCTEYIFSSVEEKATQNGNIKLKTNKNSNFWALYFSYLKSMPYFNDGRNPFIAYIAQTKVNNWSDIEYQIQYLLSHTENTINKYVKCIQIENGFDPHFKIFSCISQYEASMISNKQLTSNGVISLLTIMICLLSGWDYLSENIYDYLFKELQEFEEIFGKYLKKELNSAKENKNYVNSSKAFAKKLTNDQNYSLLNFNYTTFYKTNDPNTINIHSTLKQNGHPIFGISSDLGNNELIYQKPYYRFSKAYRIMKLTNENSIKNILPKNIDEIVFYGQSLSQADYLYFDTIFTEYDIYNSNIKLTFKYSTDFGDKDKIEQHQFSIVYRLINQFSEHINVSNLLPKLLLENRLKIEEVKNRVSN